MNNAQFNFIPFPVLATERLALREITTNDEKEIFFQRSDKSMNAYVDNPPCESLEEARAWIEKITAGTVKGDWIFWGVCLKDDPTLIGGFCYWNLSSEDRKAEIGFGIYPQHQQKGFMSEVLQTALQYGFEEMKLKCIEAYTHPENKASISVLEKNGFVLKEEQPAAEERYIVFELLR
jgi:ribosomal-protein-alanine N-acetyltransferase